MLSVHPCTNENARFTTVPLKTVFDQLRIRYYVYSLEIWLLNVVVSLQKGQNCSFYYQN